MARKQTPKTRKAVDAFRKRVRRMEQKLERELQKEFPGVQHDPIRFDVKSFIQDRKRPLRPSELAQWRDDRLKTLLVQRAMVQFQPTEQIPFKEWKEILQRVSKAQEVAQKYDPGVTIAFPTAVKTKQGAKSQRKYAEKRSKPQYWTEKGNRYVDNFMQSLRMVGTDTNFYKIMVERLNSMSTQEIIAVLNSMQESDADLFIVAFSSNQGAVNQNIDEILEFFGISYDPTYDYLGKGTDYEELTDEELEDIPF